MGRWKDTGLGNPVITKKLNALMKIGRGSRRFTTPASVTDTWSGRS
jgi:hypothetical protein